MSAAAPGMYDPALVADRARLCRLYVFRCSGAVDPVLLAEQLVDDPSATLLALWWESRSRLSFALVGLADRLAP